MPRIGTWRWRFGLAQEALSHSARVWRGAGTGSAPHGPPAPRRLPAPRGGPEMGPAVFSNDIEPRARGIVAERLGVGPEELRPDVSLADDLAVDSLDLIDLALALEAEWGVVLRRRTLESVRTYGDLLAAVAAAPRRGARRARVAPVFARARVVPAGGNGGGLERAGELTPYEIQLLVADALRAGPGEEECRLRDPSDLAPHDRLKAQQLEHCAERHGAVAPARGAHRGIRDVRPAGLGDDGPAARDSRDAREERQPAHAGAAQPQRRAAEDEGGHLRRACCCEVEPQERAERHAGDRERGHVAAEAVGALRDRREPVRPARACQVGDLGPVAGQAHRAHREAARGERLAERAHLVGRGGEAVDQEAAERPGAREREALGDAGAIRGGERRYAPRAHPRSARASSGSSGTPSARPRASA